MPRNRQGEVALNEDLYEEIMKAKQEDMRRLAKLLWGENSIDMQEPEALAIGDTVLNRMEHPSYPDTLEEVLTQNRPGKAGKPVYQYTPFNPTDPNYARIQAFDEGHPMWEKYSSMAAKALDPFRKRGGFTNYFAPASVLPSWAADLEEVADIGRHRFGRERAETRQRPAGGGGVKVK